jgi:hypothetical protein
MGLLAPDHSRGKVLSILSLTELDLALVREKSTRGRIPYSYEFFMTLASGVALGSVVLGYDVSEAAGLGLGCTKMEKVGGERRGWPGRTQFPAGFRPVTK